MTKIKKRKTPLMNKKKIVTAINLFEKYVDEPIENIILISSIYYHFECYNNNYSVDIKNNKVNKVYPDSEY